MQVRDLSSLPPDGLELTTHRLPATGQIKMREIAREIIKTAKAQRQSQAHDELDDPALRGELSR